MRKITFMMIIIALLIGVIRISVRAKADPDATAGVAATENETRVYYLPAVLMQQPHWKPVAVLDKQIPAASITKFFDTAACGEHFFGGTNEGLYRLDPATWEWVKITENDFPGDLIVAGVTFGDNKCDTVYAVARGGGLWQGQGANQGGWTWGRVDDAEAIDDDARYVLVAGKTIFLAGNFGVRWAEIPDDQASYTWQDSNLNSLVTTVSDNDGRLLAAVWNQGVYEWNKQAGQFEELPGNLPDNLVYAASAIDSNSVVGAQSGLMHATTSVEWNMVQGVPAQTTYATLAYKGVFLIGQRHEVGHRSDDGGNSWKALPPFPNTRPDADQGFQVRGFDVGLTDGQIYAATTSGVWRLVDVVP